MKHFYPLLPLTLILLLGLNSITAQTKRHNIQFGLSASGIVSVKNWSPIRTGLGSEFQLWLKKPIRNKQLLSYKIGYRQLSGFQIKSINIQERYYPDQFQSDIQTTNVASLNYLDANINWHFHLGQRSPLSIGLGLRWSYMTHWNASKIRLISESNFKPRVTENTFSGTYENSRLFNESIALSSDAFYRHNIGLVLHLEYELATGLQLSTSYTYGLNQVFQESYFSQQTNYRVSTFAIGLSARLY